MELIFGGDGVERLLRREGSVGSSAKLSKIFRGKVINPIIGSSPCFSSCPGSEGTNGFEERSFSRFGPVAVERHAMLVKMMRENKLWQSSQTQLELYV